MTSYPTSNAAPQFAPGPTIRIFLAHNAGAGFAEHVTIPVQTVGALFSERIPAAAPGSFSITVNGLATPLDQLLRENDRVAFTPAKIAGA